MTSQGSKRKAAEDASRKASKAEVAEGLSEETKTPATKKPKTADHVKRELDFTPQPVLGRQSVS